MPRTMANVRAAMTRAPWARGPGRCRHLKSAGVGSGRVFEALGAVPVNGGD